jgi:RES domain-containing protein
MGTTPTPPPFGPAWVGWETYNSFADSVTSDLRFVRSKSSDQFLDRVRTSCPTRKVTIPPKKIFYRARLGAKYKTVSETHAHGVDPDGLTVIYDKEYPREPKCMKPIPNWQGEGRANPRGIPYLYAATSPDTALSEVRPWLHALISVATLHTERELTVIDCSKHHAKDSFLNIFDDHTKSEEDGIWVAIDQAFARPVSNQDEAKDYIPTQIIAELFKSEGYDGIVYKSLLSDDGFNLALFNLDDAKVIHCELYKLDSIKFTGTKTGNEYFVGH